jgi:20S proteasome alpha/beta subunit
MFVAMKVIIMLFLLILQLGSTVIRLKTKDGVVLAIEKLVTSPLLVLHAF